MNTLSRRTEQIYSEFHLLSAFSDIWKRIQLSSETLVAVFILQVTDGVLLIFQPTNFTSSATTTTTTWVPQPMESSWENWVSCTWDCVVVWTRKYCQYFHNGYCPITMEQLVGFSPLFILILFSKIVQEVSRVKNICTVLIIKIFKTKMDYYVNGLMSKQNAT